MTLDVILGSLAVLAIVGMFVAEGVIVACLRKCRRSRRIMLRRWERESYERPA